MIIFYFLFLYAINYNSPVTKDISYFITDFLPIENEIRSIRKG